MSRLTNWWRRVFGEPAPMEYGRMSDSEVNATIPPDRMKLIEDLTQRQHDQANEITAETGRAYITRRRSKDSDPAAGITREREFWSNHGRPGAPT